MGEIKRFNPVIAPKMQLLMAVPVARTDAKVKGYGFISCEAFPEQDVFVLKSELPQGGDTTIAQMAWGVSVLVRIRGSTVLRSSAGFGPEGGHCKFKVTKEEKGPAAKQVQLLGAAGNQAQQMRSWMGYGGYPMPFMDWGKGWGKGWGK